MKNILLIALILMAYATKAQSLPDYMWYLDKLVINGEEFYPPNNEEVIPTDIQLYFEGYMMYVNSGCNQMAGEYLLDETNQSFELTEGGFAVTMNECGIQENQDFENHYFYEFYADEMMIPKQPFQYQIQAVSSGYALLVTNSLGYEAYYNSFILSSLDENNTQISIAFQNDDLIVSGLDSKLKTISVYDLNGKLVLNTKTTENQIKTDLKNGIYILKIEENGKIIKTIKLMKR